MRDSVIQLIMLGLAAISCYGYSRRAEKLFALRAEFAVFVSLSGIGLVMLLAGVLKLLQPAIYAVFALGLALAAYSLLRRESFRDFFRPGVIFLIACCGVFFVLLYGSMLLHVDNFSHWGAILKMIIQQGALPENDPLVYFPAYPTGSSLLIYYFVRITGIEAEWFWAYIQAVYLSSCAATLFCFGQYKGRGAMLPGFAATVLMALCLVCGNTDICDLLVDTLVPLAALAGVAMCIYYRGDTAKKYLPFIISAAFIPGIKNSGHLFAIVLIIFVLCLSKGRDKLRLPLLMGLSMLAVNRLWAWHVRCAFEGGMGSYHALSAESIGGGFAEKTTEELLGIGQVFFRTLINEGRLLWLLLVMAALVLLLIRRGKWRAMGGYVLGGAAVWLSWTVGMLGMYFSSMSVGEALRAAAFERYYASALVFCAGYFFIIACLATEDAGSQRRAMLPRLGLLALCAVMLCPNFSYLVPQRMRPSYEYDVRCRFDGLVEQYNIPSGLNYIVFAQEENEIIARVMCTYLLQPGTTLICSEAELGALEEKWPSYDYYICLDENEAFRSFAENVMAKTEEAGYT